MESSAGWNVHFIVLGALVAVGAALTVYDYLGPSAGSWISLRGVGSALYWMCFAAFAAASTVTFALFRARLGVPLSYVAGALLAGAVGAIVVGGWRSVQQPRARQADEKLIRELASRLTLQAWSMSEEADGVVRFKATVRADRDGSIEFDPSAAIGDYVAVDRAVRSAERVLKAGEQATLEATAKRTAQGAFNSVDLYFISRIANGETGQVVYSTDATEDTIAYGLLKRPLPAAAPDTAR